MKKKKKQSTVPESGFHCSNYWQLALGLFLGLSLSELDHGFGLIRSPTPTHTLQESKEASDADPVLESAPCPRNDFVPQVFDFVKDMQCHSDLSVPPQLKQDGRGKVFVNVGLFTGDEFFTAINSSYSAYGFEPNPTSLALLRKRCEDVPNGKCRYIDPDGDVQLPLPPLPGVGYLVGAGGSSKKGYFNLSMAGPTSSFVEDPSDLLRYKAEVRPVPLVRVDEWVDTDVFLYMLDVQGMEFEVLKGSTKLFNTRKVKTMIFELYPRGLGFAGVNYTEFMNFIWDDLGFFCSSSLAPFPTHKGFPDKTPNTWDGFIQFLTEYTPRIMGFHGALGIFDDMFCFNRRVPWEERLYKF